MPEEFFFAPEQYRFAAEYAPAHMIFADADGMIVYANPAAERITGYSRKEIIGKPLNLWGGKMPEEFYARMWQTIKVEKKPFHDELQQTRMNGESYTAEIWVTPVLGEDGKLVGFVGLEIDISDRKKLLGDLGESERRFRQLTENIKEVFFLTDPKTYQVLYLSPAFETVWGLPAAAIYKDSKLWLDAAYPEDQPKLVKALAEGLSGRESTDEFQVRRPDGSTRHLRSRSYPVLDEHGVPYRVAGFVEDITLELRARESEVRYRTLFEHMQLGVARCRMLFVDGKPDDFIYLEVNELFGALTGLKDVVGKKVTEVIPGIKTSNPELLKFYGRVTATGVAERFETHIESLKAWYSISAYKGVTEADVFVAVVDNITERKNAERERELFGKLVDQSNDGIEVLDPETFRFLDANAAACRNLGYTREELLALSVFDVEPALTKQALAEGRKVLAEKGVLVVEGVHRRKDGSTYPVENSIRFVTLDRAYIVATVRDISERKKNELRIKELDALKSKFITIVSHQLRTPLTAVHWNLEMLLAGEFAKLNPENVALVRVSYEAAGEVIHRIGDLLTALDIEEGKIRLELEEADLQSVVLGVLDEAANRCKSRGVTCTSVVADAALPAVRLDAAKIRVALSKIVDNAVSYTKEGGAVTVTIRSLQGVARIEVVDKGVGIPKSEQKRVFTRFFRASNASVMAQDASGLGLYIAKYYVEAHGGTIGFESEEGKGSTFWIDLPL